MKIAVDGYEIVEFSTGVGRVTDNIIRSLVDMMPEHDYFVCTQEKTKRYAERNIKHCVIPSLGSYFIWQNSAFVKRLNQIDPDILIASNYTLPFFNKWKSVLFEYDVSFASHPEWFSRKESTLKTYLVRRSLKKSTHIVTISEFSRGEIIRNFKIAPDKITVLSLGVEDVFQKKNEEEIKAWREKKRLKDKRIIGYLGSIFNRRNIPLLVESVDLMRNEFPDVVLYIIGEDRTHPPQNIERILKRDWIIWEKTMREAELPLFYSSIDAFAYLSEYEGFGLPPLEALACGSVPVLLNKTSLKEVFQDMAILVDDPDASHINKALIAAMTDERKKMSLLDRFKEKRPQYSWQRTARDFSSMLKKLVA